MQNYLKPILAFDSAMGGCSAAVFDPATGRAVSEIRPMARGQAEQLVPMAEAVVRKSGFEFADLGLIVTTVGPGAFTGLRIGLSTARSFGLALDVPVAGVTTTAAIARAMKKFNKNKKTLVVLETKREDFYVQLFDAAGQEMLPPSTALTCKLPERYGQEILAVGGDGVARLRDECGDGWPAAWDFVTGFDLPDPEIMAAMGLEQIRAGTLASPDPLYLRDADVSLSNKITRTIAE